ncbi:TcfC E-set like domain-containing protein [Enterobacter cloacae complex sp. 2022EL-00788]|uniref:TcfC E-set like domain-containing protein n=1 Tax=Enterobacter cloacae complex sp. 2022EL-00788 TaxID=2996512 RepID=UPI002270DE79|nr:TcfC E-set like domain-containing protein [Enterobacter cloacae complex sp. 2022EL-00788]MCY0771396.1 TcfC E-set like domain-containing protein [Enterobacter cloacae complex sp. 2022EL-00788]
MKRIVLLLSFCPFFYAEAEMTLAANMRALPEDFRRYFYESEVHAQVFLNDSLLFEAAITLTEGGKVRLIRIVEESDNLEPVIRDRWKEVLEKGVSVGECTKECPPGLMAAEYRLDNSVLKLYTSDYETARTEESFITLPERMPGGMIMYNDISVTNSDSTRSWGINSTLTASFLGWSQKASFQSSGTDGKYHYSSSNLYELYSQKEFPGHFIRLGFFTPDSDTGNVEISGFGYDTVVGAMWGTSDSLLISSDSVSAWPVYVTGKNQSIAEVWRDGRLIHTQQLESGVQALDTRRLPGGIYDITIKIIENGHIVDTQHAQIYKPQGWNNPEKRWRMNLWGGQQRTIGTTNRYGDENINPGAAGGGIDFLIHPRVVMGLSGAATENEHQVRVRSNVTLSPNDSLFAQYTTGSNDNQSNQNTDFRYYRTIQGGGSASLFWRSTTTDVYGHQTRNRQQGDVWGSSLSLRLPWSTSLTVNGQYIDTPWRKGFSTDISTTTLGSLAGRNMNFRVSGWDRPGYGNKRRDNGVSLGLSLSLAPSSQHAVSAETGMNQNRGYSSLSYQYQPEDESVLRTMGGSVSYSSRNTVLSANASVDTQFASGDGWVQHNTQGSTNTAGGNLSQVLMLGGGKMASASGSTTRGMSSALIVDVESDDDDIVIQASGKISEIRLTPGRNVVPAEQWKRDLIQFSATGGDSVKVFPEQKSIQLNKGSVQYVKVNAIKTYSLIGTLQDEQGKLLKNRFVESDVSGSVINAEGVLTLETGRNNRILKMRAEDGKPALACVLPATEGLQANSVQFVDSLKCSVEHRGNKK